jgi:hypothetical protein
LGALPCLAIAILLNILTELLSLNTAVYFILCVAIMFILLFVYYAISEKWKLFRGKGCYWIEADILHIQIDNKIYEISGVTELSGYEKSVYHSRYTTLLIEMGKEKIKLFSIPIGQETEYWYKKKGL